MSKVYVEVFVKFMTDGRLLPVQFIWEDGRKYTVERVKDIRRAASTRAGGVGMRYTCQVSGQDVFLYLEENKWFMEKKE